MPALAPPTHGKPRLFLLPNRVTLRVNPDVAKAQSGLSSPIMVNRTGHPLSIEQLEVGLRALNEDDLNRTAFWDENIHSFRRTVLFAIRDTSDALLSPTIPLDWRIELEDQLEDLVQYIELADRYIARRFLSRAPAVPEFRPAGARLH